VPRSNSSIGASSAPITHTRHEMTSRSQTSILYFLNGDWNWIKQRPHFLAQYLSGTYNVRVVYSITSKRNMTVRNPAPGMKLIPTVHVPGRCRSPALYKLDTLAMKLVFGLLILFVRPDVIWISYPELWSCLPRWSVVPVVYDCMDDHLALDETRGVKVQLRSSEASLVRAAQAVIVSSSALRKIIEQRYHPTRPPVLVRNAFGDEIIPAKPQSARRSAGSRVWRLCYIGTLNMIDFELLGTFLHVAPNVELHLIGPAGHGTIPVLPRTRYYGAVLHERLHLLVADLDCLLVPFKMQERILAADTTKIYDYINFGMPIVSVWYPEIERFRPFVEFYRTPDDFAEVLQRLIAQSFPRKYTEGQRVAFLAENSWAKRAEVLEGVLDSLMAPTAPYGGRHG
jgi:teichuronic acid biosynthesis glycosyltransferase TuaH